MIFNHIICICIIFKKKSLSSAFFRLRLRLSAKRKKGFFRKSPTTLDFETLKKIVSIESLDTLPNQIRWIKIQVESRSTSTLTTIVFVTAKQKYQRHFIVITWPLHNSIITITKCCSSKWEIMENGTRTCKNSINWDPLYLLLERITIIAAYTRTIEANNAVPNETLTIYSASYCRRKG